MPTDPAPPVRLGSAFFSLVEPHPGHVVEYNEWYERDHFYAACLMGPSLFAGRRWVATRAHKNVRYPSSSPIASPVTKGSFLHQYWIVAGGHDEYVDWAVHREAHLYRDGRIFEHRDHVYSQMAKFEWSLARDDDPVPAELSLDHPFGGLVYLVIDRVGGVSCDQVLQWHARDVLPTFVGTPVALMLAFSLVPLRNDARLLHLMGHEGLDSRMLLACFVDEDPLSCWPGTFASYGGLLAASGLAQLLFAAPFIPTIPGTDRYLDQL